MPVNVSLEKCVIETKEFSKFMLNYPSIIPCWCVVGDVDVDGYDSDGDM